MQSEWANIGKNVMTGEEEYQYCTEWLKHTKEMWGYSWGSYNFAVNENGRKKISNILKILSR